MAQEPAAPAGDEEEVIISKSPDPAVAEAEAAAAAKEGDPGTPQPPVEEGMAEAIAKQLKIPTAEKEPAKPADKEPAKPAARPAAGEPAKPTTPTAEEKAATAAAEKKAADDKAAAATKKADDFQLSAEEKKVISSKAQQRFHEIHVYAKEQEALVEKAQSDIKALTAARDNILDTFAQYKVDPDDLQTLMEVHLAIKDGRFEDALKWVDDNRAKLLTALGREAPGVDLLKDFPDLAREVEEETMTRARALELASARRREQNVSRESQDQQRARQAESTAQKKQDDAIAELEKWTKGLAAKDIDYKAKEAKILPKLDWVIKKYPAELWLPTLQGLYDGIEIVKAPAPAEIVPLRPSGARGGGKEPATMEEAIGQAVKIAS